MHALTPTRTCLGYWDIRTLRSITKQEDGHLESPAARIVRAGIMAHGVVVAHEAVLGAQVHAPPYAAIPLLAGRVVAQEVAAHKRLGVGGATARAACSDLQMHCPSLTNLLAGCARTVRNNLPVMLQARIQTSLTGSLPVQAKD